jgi:ribosomal protein S18 acetylase RimI-like enzyme
MNIRPLTESDIPSLTELVDASEHLSTTRITLYWLFSSFFTSTSLVMEDDGKVVGACLGFLDQEEGKIGYIHKLGVLKEYREQGIATRLMDAFGEAAATKGATTVALTTLPENEHAIAFYENRGFTRKEITKLGKARVWYDRSID